MATSNDAAYFAAVQSGFIAVNTDDASPAYHGFESPDGTWYIMKVTVSGDITTYSYTKGASGYSAAWTARASKTYGLPSEVWA